MVLSNTLENLTGCLVAAGFLLAFAALVAWLIRRERAKVDAERQALARLGFTQVAQPGEEMFALLEALHRRSPRQKFELRGLYERQVTDGRFLVFDLVETSGDDNTYLGANAMAVQSARLRLPRATLLGRMSFEGKTAAWMVGAAEKVMNWAASQSGMQRLDLAEAPELESSFIVLAEVEREARAFFTRDRLLRLTWLSDTSKLSALDCQGDLFVIKRQTTPARPDAYSDLASLLRDAQLAWNALEEGR